MAKLLWIMGLICLAACAQLTVARDLAEALNNNLREQLGGYQTFLSQDDGTHRADLETLIQLTESALKEEGFEAKQALIKDLPAQFSPEFNQYVSTKMQEFHVNHDIADAIQFYNTLLENAELHDEVQQTTGTLENLLKETDLQVKIEKFRTLNQAFSPALVDFLKSNSLPKVNHELQHISEFFGNLLVEQDIKYAAEIRALKEQAEAGLLVSDIEEKQRILHAVTNPSDPDFFQFLQTKFIEHQ